ncbi:MauE/DoxX family redox-associated membrane protein [Priestia aryabhattai]
MQKYTIILAIILFTCFTITILINVIRGNRNIDCGCGGILGDQQISWKIIIRNLLFVCALSFLSAVDISYSSVDSLILGNEETFDSYSFLVIFLAISTLFIFSTYTNLLKIKNKLLEFK